MAGLTEHDGSFRRLIETVKKRQAIEPSGKPGRPAKNRVSTTGHFSVRIHSLMKALADARSEHVDHQVSTSDVYTAAATELLTDLHDLLGEDMQLPAGAVSLPAILGLRELVARPLKTPLRELELQPDELHRTTVYIDQTVWDALAEMRLRFSLSMRRTIVAHRLIELAAAWYLAGIDTAALAEQGADDAGG